MKVQYRTKKLKKECEDPRIAQNRYGSRMGNILTLRVVQLLAAENLSDIQFIRPARLHRLKGNRAGQFAVDLVHPYRLVFIPILEEGEDINNLESIRIVKLEGVIDYHGKKRR